MTVTDSLPASKDLKPDFYYRQKAMYTDAARSLGVQGTVILQAVFRADGRITDIKVIRGLPYGLSEEAISALTKFKFRPALKDGQPVCVRMSIEFSFHLLEGPTPAPMANIEKPKILNMDTPNYPEAGQQNKVKGKVVLKALFNLNGKITDIEVVKGLPYGLTEEAIRVLQTAKFEPAKVNGQPVSLLYEIEIKFPPKKK